MTFERSVNSLHFFGVLMRTSFGAAVGLVVLSAASNAQTPEQSRKLQQCSTEWKSITQAGTDPKQWPASNWAEYIKLCLHLRPITSPPENAGNSAVQQAGQTTISTDNRETMPPTTGKPSFDCAKAKSASARLICSDADLSKADGALRAKFKSAIASRDEAAKKQLVGEQLVWLRERNKRCGVGPDKTSISVDQLVGAKPCMMQAIAERIALLSSSGLAATTNMQTGAQRCTEEFNVKKRNGDLPPGAELKGFLDWCMKQSPGESIAASSNVGSAPAHPPIRAERNFAETYQQAPNIQCFDSMNPPMIDMVVYIKDGFANLFSDDNEVRNILTYLGNVGRTVCKKSVGPFNMGVDIISLSSHFLARSNDGNNWSIQSNGIAEQSRNLAAQRRFNEAQERQQQIRQQQIASAKVKVQADLGIQTWVNTNQLSSNPFLYKGTIVGTLASFDHMISESEAIFTGGNGIYVSHVPSALFQGNEYVVLAGRVTGNKAVKTPLGGEVMVPALDYIGVYKCGCEGF
jgi:uncharacterized protein YecT (DUF1311 family)